MCIITTCTSLVCAITMEPDNRNIYPENLAVFAYQHGNGTVGEDVEIDRFVDADRFDGSTGSPESTTFDDGDSGQSTFGVDLSGKATNLTGKNFTIAAILGLTTAEEDAMNLSVQQRIHQGQRHLQNYLYVGGHEVQRIGGDGFGRTVPVVRQDSPRPGELRNLGQMKARGHSICNSSAGRNKRIRTIFTPEQLERLEAEFERQQYMVGPERLYLAHALQLTEAQVKVWFQNRRIKWRKHHLEVTQQRLAVLQRHRAERDDDI